MSLPHHVQNTAAILALAPVAWFRYGIGITTATGVSQWADQSGNANHLAQATGSLQPVLNADKSITFDGVDDYLKATFTLNQPETIYVLAGLLTDVNGQYLFDGVSLNAGGVRSLTGYSPRILAPTSSDVTGAGTFTAALFATAAVFNGASSLLTIKSTSSPVVNAGANNMGGITVGAAGSLAAFANMKIAELIVFPVAHDADTRTRVIRYLGRVGGIAV